MAYTREELDIAKKVKEQWGTKQDFLEVIEQMRWKVTTEEKVTEVTPEWAAEVTVKEEWALEPLKTPIPTIDKRIELKSPDETRAEVQKEWVAKTFIGKAWQAWEEAVRQVVLEPLKAIANIPASAYDLVASTINLWVSAVADPVNTAKVVWEWIKQFTAEEKNKLEEAHTKWWPNEVAKVLIDQVTKYVWENPADFFTLKSILTKKIKPAKDIASKVEWLEQKAATDVEQFLKPTKVATKAKTKEIIPWFIDRLKKWQLNPSDRIVMKAQTEKVVEKVWKDIWDFIEAWKVKWEVKFDKMIDTLAKEDSKLRVNWEIIPWNEASVKFIDSQLKFFWQLEKQFWTHLPPAKQVELRQKYDAVFDKWVTRDKITKFQDDLQLKLADSLRAELAKNNPELDALNKEFTFYKGLDTVLWETIDRTTWQATVWLLTEIRKQSQWTVWAIAWWTIWSALWPIWALWWALIWWAIWAKLTKTLANPKYKLVSAKKKADLADAIASWNKSKVQKALNAIEKSFILWVIAPEKEEK